MLESKHFSEGKKKQNIIEAMSTPFPQKKVENGR